MSDSRPGSAPGWWRFAEATCARLTAADPDRTTADREVARLVMTSRIGGIADRFLRAIEAAWCESRTRTMLRWLLQGR
jgi:hypothetical protein